MSFGFVPSGPAGEASVDLAGEHGPDRQHPPAAAALAVRSPRGRGHLLVSAGLVSFNSGHGDDAVHVGDALRVTHSMWASRIVLETSTGPLEVSVSRWHRRRLLEMLRSAGLQVTSPSGNGFPA